MDTVTKILCKEIQKKSRSKIAKYSFGLILFMASTVVCIVGIVMLALDGVKDVSAIIGCVVICLFSLVMSVALANGLKELVKQYKFPFEAKAIKAALESGVSNEDIYKTLTAPLEMVLGICVGEKCLTLANDITKTFAWTNVSKIYMTIHTTNCVEDRYGITIEDVSGEKILEWNEITAFSRKESKQEVVDMIHKLEYYWFAAK